MHPFSFLCPRNVCYDLWPRLWSSHKGIFIQGWLLNQCLSPCVRGQGLGPPILPSCWRHSRLLLKYKYYLKETHFELENLPNKDSQRDKWEMKFLLGKGPQAHLVLQSPTLITQGHRQLTSGGTTCRWMVVHPTLSLTWHQDINNLSGAGSCVDLIRHFAGLWRSNKNEVVS